MVAGCVGDDPNVGTANIDPEASISSHTSGDVVMERTTVTFEGSADDDDDDAADLEATWLLDGEVICDWTTPSDAGLSVCTIALPASADLSSGTVTVEFQVRDPLDAIGAGAVTLVVQSSQAPVTTIVAPADGGVGYADQPTALIGHATDDLDGADLLVSTWTSDLDGSLATGTFDANGDTTANKVLTAGIHVLTLTAEDTAGQLGADSVSVRIFETNTAPTCAIVAPEDGSSGVPGTVFSFAGTASDVEEEALNLEITWESDLDGVFATGGPTANGDTSVDFELIAAGTHTVTLTATDSGHLECSDTVTVVVGSPPVIVVDSPVDDEVFNHGADVAFAGTVADDVDAADELLVTWTSDVDGIIDTTAPDPSGVMGFATSTLSVGPHVITITATDSEGLVASAAVDVRINGLPSAPSIRLSPDPARTGDDLVVTVDVEGVDPEADPVTYAYQWSVDGTASVGNTTSVLSANATTKEETWTITVTPNDGLGDGNPAIASVVIANTPPSMASVVLTPDPAYEGDRMHCTPFTGSDADEDLLTYTYAWWLNGVRGPATGFSLSSAYWSKHDTISCAATPWDGVDFGDEMYSNEVVASNAIPSLISAVISPSDPTVADELICTPTGFDDGDGDDNETTIAWSIGGVVVGTGPTLSGAFVIGDTVTCEATAHDGESDGNTVMDSVLVDNGAPSIGAVEIAPADPVAADSLLCAYSGFSDADGDPDLSAFEWTLNGLVVGTEATLANGFVKGDVVTCTVTPADGFEFGTPQSTSVTVRNTLPVVDSAVLTPDPAREGDVLVCTAGATFDGDVDDVTVSYSWLVDGGDPGVINATLSDANWSRDQQVTCVVTPHDGEDPGLAVSSNTVTIANSIPSLAFVAITPANPEVTDDLECLYAGFTDADEDDDQTLFAWTVNGLNAGTSSVLAAGGFIADDEVTCTVTAYDGTDAGTERTATVTLGNSAPSIAAVTISPDAAVAGETLSCAYSGYLDSDGDPDQSTLSWTINGISVSSDPVLNAGFGNSDVVVCTVTPFDGLSSGTALQDTVVIDNTAPVLSDAVIIPNPAFEGDLLSCLPVGGFDADGEDVTYEYVWTVDGVDAGVADDTLSSTDWNKGQAVRCTVTPNDGTVDGDAVSSSLTISNSLPSVVGVDVTPAEPRVGDTLTCTYSGYSDADDDADDSSISWSIDGAVVGTSATLSAGFKSGDTVTCSVTPNDGEEDGVLMAFGVDVQNTAPALDSVDLSPTDAVKGDTLGCTPGTLTDPDLDDVITYTYAWTVNSLPVAATTDTLADEWWSRDDEVACTVIPNDGAVDGDPVTSNTVSIGNALPTVTWVTINPRDPQTADELNCGYLSFNDPDGDADLSTWRWTISGVEVGTDPTLSSSLTTLGDVVKCTITPFDGLDQGESKAHTVVVVSTPPVMTEATLTPAEPREGDLLTCAGSATDVDGDDITYSYTWTVGGELLDETTETLDGAFWDKHEEVFCTVTGNDDVGSGAGLDSITVTVQNSVPSVDTVSIDPPTPGTGDTLTCLYTGFTDADSDGDLSTYRWTIGGFEVGTDASLDSSLTTLGDVVTCAVTPYDGDEAGTVMTGEATVGNTAPSVATVSIAPLSPGIEDDLTCSYTGFDDIDGDADLSTFSWTIDGVQVGTDPILSGALTTTSDRVHCTVTPHDGFDAGVPVDSAVTVDSTVPSMVDVVLTPDPAFEGDVLTCTPSATDIDGDTIDYTYLWTVDSEGVGADTDTLDDSLWGKGQQVVCTVTPSDVSGAGASLPSNAVTIQNTAPSIVSATILPIPPGVADVLDCSHSGFVDPDGDADLSTYSWMRDGIEVGTSATLSITLAIGEILTCTITPFDGEATGATVSDTVTIENSAPVITSVTISPEFPTFSDPLTCTAEATDADGDPFSLAYEWTVDEAVLGTESTLSSGFFGGDVVLCTVTPSDPTGVGATDFDAVTIGNTPPTAHSLSITPSDPVNADVMSVSFGTSDVDGDLVSVTYAWFVNEGLASTDETLTVAGMATEGDAIRVELTPFDGFEAGLAAVSPTVFVGNTAPGAPTVEVTLNPVINVDDIVCSVTSPAVDVDPDPVSYRFTWMADGAVYPDDFPAATGPTMDTEIDDTIPAGDTDLATDWTCLVEAFDGDVYSDAAQDTATVIPPPSDLTDDRALIGSPTCSMSGSHNPNVVYSQPFTLASGATVTGFGIHLVESEGCNFCSMAVYSDDAGPGLLLGEATGSCVEPDGDNRLQAEPFSLPDAGTYWVTHWLSGCNVSLPTVCESSSPSQVFYGPQPSPDLPPTFSAVGTYTDGEFATWVLGY